MKELNCFYNPDIILKPISEGALSGLTFAAKDLYDVKGHVCACGNPTWAATHSIATSNAQLIDDLLKVGATLRGKTHMNELAYGMDGDNIHFGMPINPIKPDSIPGGSSSGSAGAVAAGIVDFALGTDTAGSIRVPASYCGVFGLRPTYNSLTLKGAMPLSQTFDVAGFFAKDGSIFQRVSSVLFKEETFTFNNCLVLDDAFEQVDTDLQDFFRNLLPRILTVFDSVEHTRIAPNGLNEWRDICRFVQGYEVWNNHGVWYSKYTPLMSKEISDRFKWAATIDKGTYKSYMKRKEKTVDYIDAFIKKNTILVLPTVPGTAPSKYLASDVLDNHRFRALNLTCISGISGRPQVTIPCKMNGKPVGLSLIGPKGSDFSLVQLAVTLSETLAD